jgi:hypothetical protein
MRKIFTLLVLTVLLFSLISFGQVSINSDGTSPNSSTMLDIKSTTKGLLPPRVALTSPTSLGIVKNGVTSTRYGETNLRVASADQPYQFSTVVYLPDVGATDYFEVWCTSSTNGDVVTFQDINWFADTQ